MIMGAAWLGGCATGPSDSPTPSAPITTAEPEPEEPTTEPPKPKPRLATRFSDKDNTLVGIDGTNKTWKGGVDLKPGKYRTVDNFDPEYDAYPGLSCVASSAPDSDDLEGEREFDAKWHAILKVRDGDLVRSVGCARGNGSHDRDFSGYPPEAG
jgi:hypothetical protein